MPIAILLIIYVVALVIGTVVGTAALAFSLFVVEDNWADSYQEQGIGSVLIRCAILVVISTLFHFVPFGGILAMIIWFAGIMYFFQKTFVQTIILSIVNAAIGFAIMWCLRMGIELAVASLIAAN